MGPDLIASILVLTGAGFMVFSIRLGRSLQRVVPNKLQKRWQILILLKVFFLAGYLSFVSLLFSSYNFPLELVTGIIFLGGAFFVFIVINISKDTIRSIKEKEKEIKEQQYSGNVITIHDNTETKSLEKTQQELKDAYDELKNAQSQMLQKEKMASIGQLAAGVAHEINNPMGYIASNVNSLGRYTKKITEFINVQDEAIASADLPELSKELNEKRKKLKLDFILEDIDQLIEESLDGADRVKNIVQNLKSFSRVDEAEHQSADINECIESTLNIVWNELKYKATVTKDYGELPMTNCYPLQLNQVFMNLLVNAAHAIEKEGEINIRTWNGDGHVNISISDTGEGIPKDKIDKIFEPFYTTKPVGKGTGLGLSITYDIIKNHNGVLSVNSEVDNGTTFNIRIPVIGNDNHG